MALLSESLRRIRQRVKNRTKRHHTGPTGLLDLPNELLLHIADYTDRLRDLSYLLRANRRLAGLLGGELLRRAGSQLCASPARRTRFQTNPTPGRTVLHFAAAHGYEDFVRQLLQHGAAPCLNVRDHFGATPLISATLGGHTGVVSLLLCAGADPNLAPGREWFPLHIAAMSGNVAITILLCQANANPNATMGMRITPFHLAIIGGHLQVSKLLLAAGADRSSLSGIALNNESLAMLFGSWEVLEWLISDMEESIPPLSLRDMVPRGTYMTVYMRRIMKSLTVMRKFEEDDCRYCKSAKKSVSGHHLEALKDVYVELSENFAQRYSFMQRLERDWGEA